jgi:putative spermidine/putrescine transport system substrate-binding protein
MAKTILRTTRRSFVRGASAAAAGTLAAPAVLRKAWAADPLKVSAYGGYFEDALNQNVYPEFTKATGIPIQTVSQQGDTGWFTVLEQSMNAGNPMVDITMTGGGDPLRFNHLFASLDQSKMPNVGNVPDYLQYHKDDGSLDALAVLAWYSIFVTNTDVFPDPPASWADAWGDQFKGQLGWPGEADSSYLIDIVAHTFYGGGDVMKSRDGLLKCMQKGIELKDNVKLWYRDEGQFQAQLQSGELNGGQYFHDVTLQMAADGFPVRSTFPKEGGVIDFGCWAVLTTCKRVEEAQEFINFCVDPSTQKLISTSMGTAPVIRRELLDMSDEEFAHVSSTIPPIVIAYDVYVKDGDWIAEKWQELLTGAGAG